MGQIVLCDLLGAGQMRLWQGVRYSGLRNSVDNLLLIIRDSLNYREYLLFTLVLLAAIIALCAAASTRGMLGMRSYGLVILD